jgi:hypothetical protein
MNRTLAEWIELNRPLGWTAGLSSEGEVKYGSVKIMQQAWDSGAIKFGKVPVKLAALKEDGTFAPARKAGKIRPLLDPEPPIEGEEFFLAWHNGIEWSDHFDPLYVGLKGPGFLKGDDLKRYHAARDAELKRILPGMDEALLEELFPQLVQPCDVKDSFRSFARALTQIIEGNHLLGLAIAYSRGRSAGRAEVTREMRNSIEVDRKRSRKKDWVDVVIAALERHGDDLTPTELLIEMKGSRHPIEKKWTFPGGEEVDQSEFLKACRAANKRPSNRALRKQTEKDAQS